MFGVSWTELLVIGLVALIVAGPEKLPEMARTAGKIYYQLKRAGAEVSRTFSAEIDLLGSEAAEVREELDKDSPEAVSEGSGFAKPEKTEAAKDA